MCPASRLCSSILLNGHLQFQKPSTIYILGILLYRCLLISFYHIAILRSILLLYYCVVVQLPILTLPFPNPKP